MTRRPPRSTRTDTLCPYTRLILSLRGTDPLRSLSAQETTIRASPQPCRRLDDRQEFRRGQARAANQRAVDVARAEQFGGIVTIDRATIEEAQIRRPGPDPFGQRGAARPVHRRHILKRGDQPRDRKSVV